MKFYERGDAVTNANAEVGAPATPEDDAAVIDKLV
jgi:hypothetical protein